MSQTMEEMSSKDRNKHVNEFAIKRIGLYLFGNVESSKGNKCKDRMEETWK